MTKKNKTVTVKFTAAEAEWLVTQFERRVVELQEKIKSSKHPSERESYLLLKFQTEALRDRIRSES
jgi:hypothetical protein